MKHLLLGTALVAASALSASAQDLFRSASDPAAITASDFIGQRIYAAEADIDADQYDGAQDGWDDIGEVNDVVLTRDGKVDSVLVDIGGFLGMGERKVALGMENIRFVADSGTADDPNDYFLVIKADRSVLEGAPEYKQTGAAAATGDAADTTAAETTVAAADGTEPAAMADPMVEGYAMVDMATVTAKELTGVNVYGSDNEDVGEVADVVLDDKGAAAKVIVDVGGFLGLGSKPVALDATAIQIMRATDGDALRAYVSLTKEELESLPEAKM
jgi:sporulation protein YlmC with PRC-barrel domain